MGRQQLTDGRIAPFSYITHAAMSALHEHFDRAREVKLSTGIALYVGIAYLTSIEKAREKGIEATREEIGKAGGVSATNVTRYSQHLVSAEVLELEQLVARGANVYRWTLVEPPFQAPHQGGEAGGSPHQGGEAPNQAGESPHQGGEAYREEENRKKKAKTPCSPPEGDGGDPVVEIFDFWKRVMGFDSSTRLTPNRKRAIGARLKEGRDPGYLKQAVANVAASDWHMKRGRHAGRDGREQNDLVLICRNGEKLEQYFKMGGGSPIAEAGAAAERGPVTLTDGASDAWERAKLLLAAKLPDSTFGIWFEPLQVAGERGGKLVLLDSSEQGVVGWVDRKYRPLVLEAIDGFDDIEIVDQTQLEYEAR